MDWLNDGMNEVTTDSMEVKRREIPDRVLCDVTKLSTDSCMISKLLIGTFQIKCRQYKPISIISTNCNEMVFEIFISIICDFKNANVILKCMV